MPDLQVDDRVMDHPENFNLPPMTPEEQQLLDELRALPSYARGYVIGKLTALHPDDVRTAMNEALLIQAVDEVDPPATPRRYAIDWLPVLAGAASGVLVHILLRRRH